MRRAAYIAGFEPPLIVAVTAELSFMATRAEVLIGAGRDWMASHEIITMHVDHVVSQLTHFIGKA